MIWLSVSVIMSIISFLFGCAEKKDGYHKSKGLWLFDQTVFYPESPESFKLLSQLYAADDLKGYYRGSVISSSIGKSFLALDKYYAKDQRQVYYCETYRKGEEYYGEAHNRIFSLTTANPAEFMSLGDGYARDDSRVYFQGKRFEVLDPLGFHLLQGDFASDNLSAYYFRKIIKDSHPASFKVLSEKYALDENNVWFLEKNYTDQSCKISMLNGAKPASFIVLSNGYTKDDKQVFYEDRLVLGARAEHFHLLKGREDADASDGTHLYYQGLRLGKKY